VARHLPGRHVRRDGTLRFVLAAAPGRSASDGPAPDSLYLGGVPVADGRWDPLPAGADGTAAATKTVALRLTVVTADRDGTVALAAEPYWDPGCGCTVTLSFTGRLAGDTLAGRFRAAAAATQVPDTRTRWRVVRAAMGRPRAAAVTRRPP
jgi:hypothetical protein